MRTGIRAVLPAAVPLLWVLATGVAPAVAGTQLGPVEVRVEVGDRSMELGESRHLQVQVTNNATTASPPLTVHLDITDPAAAHSVDPEDWTSTLNQTTPALPPGAGATLEWTLQPISGGSFALYAVALAPGADTLASSNVLTIEVTDRRSLNPGGIAPVAIGIPGLVGAALLVQVTRARRVS